MPERDIFPGRCLFSTVGAVSSPRCSPLFPAVYRWLGTSLVHRRHPGPGIGPTGQAGAPLRDRRMGLGRSEPGRRRRPARSAPTDQNRSVPATTTAPGAIAGTERFWSVVRMDGQRRRPGWLRPSPCRRSRSGAPACPVGLIPGRLGKQVHRCRIVGWDWDEVNLAVGVDLLDPHHRPEPLVPAIAPGAVVVAGTERFWSVVRIEQVDGQVGFIAVPSDDPRRAPACPVGLIPGRRRRPARSAPPTRTAQSPRPRRPRERSRPARRRPAAETTSGPHRPQRSDRLVDRSSASLILRAGGAGSAPPGGRY